jgi:hypothetical protein
MLELFKRSKSELTQINLDTVLKINALIFFLLPSKSTRNFVMRVVGRKEESLALLLDRPGVEFRSYI